MTNTSEPLEKQKINITRIFNAPRKLVWKAWTDCNLIKQWWGPKGFTAPFCQNELRVGGKSLYSMRGDENMGIWSRKEIWSTGVYREIVPLERIVTSDSFSDEKGNIVPASHYGMSANFPLEMMITVTFKELKDKTELNLEHVGFPSSEESNNARMGWIESLEKLDKLLIKLKQPS